MTENYGRLPVGLVGPTPLLWVDALEDPAHRSLGFPGRVVAITGGDTLQDSKRAYPDPTWYDSFAAMVEGQVRDRKQGARLEAVVIDGSAGAATVHAALEAGLHVLLIPPVRMSYEDAVAAVSIADEHGVALSVGYQHLLLLQGGAERRAALGQLEHARVQWLWNDSRDRSRSLRYELEVMLTSALWLVGPASPQVHEATMRNGRLSATVALGKNTELDLELRPFRGTDHVELSLRSAEGGLTFPLNLGPDNMGSSRAVSRMSRHDITRVEPPALSLTDRRYIVTDEWLRAARRQGDATFTLGQFLSALDLAARIGDLAGLPA